MSPERVFVGLSGGVDSAVSAALLQREGFDVVGVFIRIALPGYPCTAGADKIEAMRVAAHLRIPFFEIDLSHEYHESVFAHSVTEFARGHTPNPDVLCNKEIKFGIFYNWAIAHGADVVATGHYARLRHNKDGAAELRTGKDTEKDQSYFLWMAPEDALRRTRFPVGELRKTEVRALAKQLQLPNAERKDSQGLCFLGPIELTDMLERELHPTPGSVLSEDGDAIGTHNGAVLYTLGQRHGFSITAVKKDTGALAPYFVIAKDSARNTITVSPERTPKDKSQTRVSLCDTRWIGEVRPGVCTARFRYRQPLISATLDDSKTLVTLNEAHYIPDGQSLVLYRGDRCLGGGTVEHSEPC